MPYEVKVIEIFFCHILNNIYTLFIKLTTYNMINNFYKLYIEYFFVSTNLDNYIKYGDSMNFIFLSVIFHVNTN